MIMDQSDMERFAFLFLCGKHDKGVLSGKENMTFSDLERLMYLSDFFGLKVYSMEIWNEYAGQFKEQLQCLEKLYDESYRIVPWGSAEVEDDVHEEWVREFCRQVADRKSRDRLKEITKQIYREKGWESTKEIKT